MGLSLKVINAAEGLFALGRGERDSFRRHLAQHGVQCDLFGPTGDVWPEGNASGAVTPAEDYHKPVHPEDIGIAIDVYSTWRANQVSARSE